MKKNAVWGLVTVLVLGGIAGCTSLPNSQPQDPTTAHTTSADNLVGLFLIKKDNLRNQIRGELYPIAFHTHDAYIDASQDVTWQVRADFDPDRLIQLNQSKSLLQAIKSFTVMDGNQTLGQFQVDQLGVSQFACSTFLTGQGQFQGKQPLQALYESLPSDRAGGFKGSIGNRQLDETWRWTIAASRYTSSPSASPPAIDEAAVKQAILTAVEPVLTQATQASADKPVVERMQVFDLDRDGKPEVFATVRQGADPKSTPAETLQRGAVTVYVTAWLSYRNNQPTLLASDVTRYEFPVSRTPYDVIGTLDMNGDGIEEVLVKNNGYESTSFGIHQLQETTLKPVFTGAEYGC